MNILEELKVVPPSILHQLQSHKGITLALRRPV